MRTLFGLALLAASATTAAADAGPVDLSELFPGDCPFYFEVRRPNVLAVELGTAFRGTVLQDSLGPINRLRDRPKQPLQPPADTSWLGALGAIFGPEMLAETARFGGFAVGVTGYTKAREPAVAAVLATGDSHLPGLVMRAFLTTSQAMRKIATVEGVDLYQEMTNPVAHDIDGPIPANGAPGAPEPVPTGWVYAYGTGRVIIASDKTAAAAVIRRWKGKEVRQPLWSAAEFNAFRDLREGSLAFAYAAPRPLFALTDVPDGRQGRQIDSPGRAILKELLTPDSIRGIAAGWTVDHTDYCLRLEAHLEPGRTSPILDLLAGAEEKGPGSKVTTPAGTAQVSVAFADPNGRGKRLVGVADAIARGAGSIGITPGEALQELGANTHVDLAAEFLDKVAGVTVVLPPPHAWPKEGWPWPTIVLHSESVAAAAVAEKALPSLLKLAGAKSADPTAETISGIRVYSVAGDGLNGPAGIHFATHGRDFAVGADRSLLAALFSEVNKTSPDKDRSGRNGQLAMMAPWQSILPAVLGMDPPGPALPARRLRVEGIEPTTQVAADPRVAVRSAFDDLFRIAGSLPPVVGSLRRDGTAIRAELRQPNARASCGKVIDKCVEWAARALDANGESPFAPGAGAVPTRTPVDR